MKTTKMKISGIAMDNNFYEPLIILKSEKGRTFPVSAENYDRKSLAGAFVLKNNIHSELVVKLIKLTNFKVKEIVLDKNESNKLVAKVTVSDLKIKTVEMSPVAGILLCVETGSDILINNCLFEDTSFFKNKIDNSKTIKDFEKMFLDNDDFPDFRRMINSDRETVH